MTITLNEGLDMILTTAHAVSSHGIPVLVIEGQAYGPGDLVDTNPMFGGYSAGQCLHDVTGAEIVRYQAEQAGLSEHGAVRLFLATA